MARRVKDQYVVQVTRKPDARAMTAIEVEAAVADYVFDHSEHDGITSVKVTRSYTN